MKQYFDYVSPKSQIVVISFLARHKRIVFQTNTVPRSKNYVTNCRELFRMLLNLELIQHVSPRGLPKSSIMSRLLFRPAPCNTKINGGRVDEVDDDDGGGGG